MTHGMGQIAHGADHITVHLKTHLSELIHPLPHHNLLMLHLQTLAFWRRYDNDGPTLSQQTCQCARTRPDISLARVLALRPPGMTLVTRSIRLANTHETYTKYQHRDEIPQTDLPFTAHRLQRSTDVVGGMIIRYAARPFHLGLTFQTILIITSLIHYFAV